jgi:hypothetical protein
MAPLFSAVIQSTPSNWRSASIWTLEIMPRSPAMTSPSAIVFHAFRHHREQRLRRVLHAERFHIENHLPMRPGLLDCQSRYRRITPIHPTASRRFRQ